MMHMLLYRKFNTWLSISFAADGVSLFILGVSLVAALLVVAYALKYFKEDAMRRRFLTWAGVGAFGMAGLCVSANLPFMYFFLEILCFSVRRLVRLNKEKGAARFDKAILINGIGSALLLAGIVFVYRQHGSLELNVLKGLTLNDPAAFLLLAGIAAKSALFPFHAWLVDASSASMPVAALVQSAFLMNAGVYLFARLFCLEFSVTEFFIEAARFVSVAALVVAAASALVQNTMKKILTYSTVSAAGFIMMTLLGHTQLAIQIALLYILAHSIAKAGLFFAVGVVDAQTGTDDINRLGGLRHTMPKTAAAYVLCAFSLAGIPPFLGFWPKYMITLESLRHGHILWDALSMAAALLTLFYLFRLFNMVFNGAHKTHTEEKGVAYLAILAGACGVAVLVMGLLVKIPLNLIQAVF